MVAGWQSSSDWSAAFLGPARHLLSANQWTVCGRRPAGGLRGLELDPCCRGWDLWISTRLID